MLERAEAAAAGRQAESVLVVKHEGAVAGGGPGAAEGGKNGAAERRRGDFAGTAEREVSN